METKNYIVLIILLGLAIPVYWHELHRYNQCLEQCNEDHQRDFALLEQDICQSAYKRIQFKDRVDCEGAERRIKVSVRDCALHKWRLESHLMHILSTMTHSYWAILGWTLPLGGFFMWLWSLERREDKWISTYEKRLMDRTPTKYLR